MTPRGSPALHRGGHVGRHVNPGLHGAPRGVYYEHTLITAEADMPGFEGAGPRHRGRMTGGRRGRCAGGERGTAGVGRGRDARDHGPMAGGRRRRRRPSDERSTGGARRRHGRAFGGDEPRSGAHRRCGTAGDTPPADRGMVHRSGRRRGASDDASAGGRGMRRREGRRPAAKASGLRRRETGRRSPPPRHCPPLVSN